MSHNQPTSTAVLNRGRAIKSTVTKVSGTERAVRSTYSAGEEVLRCVALTYLSATDLAAQPPNRHQRNTIRDALSTYYEPGRTPQLGSQQSQVLDLLRSRQIVRDHRQFPPSAQADDL